MDYCFTLLDLGGYFYGGISFLICMVVSVTKLVFKTKAKSNKESFILLQNTASALLLRDWSPKWDPKPDRNCSV